MHPLPCFARLGVLAVAATALVACADPARPHDGLARSAPTQLATTTLPSAIPTTTTPPPAVSTRAAVPLTTSVGPDVAVLEAVRAFWDTFVEVGGRSGPFDPVAVRNRLLERTTGEQTATLFRFFQGNAVAGYVVRGGFDLAPKVISNDGSVARVRDCHDDHTGVYRLSDGVRIDSDDPERHQVLMTLQLEGGTWKVASVVTEGHGCVAS